MKAVRPLRIYAKGRTRFMASKLKINAFELCTNHDSANCQPCGQRVSSRLPDLARPRLIR
jgi:hypothetical protein